MLALIPVARWLLRISGHAPEVLDAELRYVTILMLGSIGPALNNAMGSFFIGRGRTRVTMTTNMCANLVNVALAYTLIFGAFGFPEWGITGAAIASTGAGLISPAILLALFLSPSNNAQYDTRHAFRLVPHLFWRMLRFGLPSAVNVFLDVAAFTVFVMLTGRMEGAALATSNIALSINNLAFMPLLGLSIAVMTLVGNHQGARNPQLAQRATWSTIKVGAAYTLVLAISFLVVPSAYYSLFTGNEEKAYHLDQLLPMGRQLLVMMAIWGMFDVVNLVLAGALKGAGDTRFVMIWSMIAAWAIWVPGQIVLVTRFHGGIRAIWIWMTVYIVILAGGYFLRFRAGAWKRITLIERGHTPIDVVAPS
jgi:MATE family multidrug resistance protein